MAASSDFDSRISVSTADNVALGYTVAGVGSRGAAYLLDGIIVTGLLIVLLIGMGVAADSLGFSTELLSLALTTLSIILYVGYFLACELLTGGKTPGKSALGLRVIRADGGAAGPREFLLRNLARVLDASLGFFFIFFHPRSQRIGDLLAGTVVVHERSRATLQAVTAPVPVFLRSPDSGPPLGGVERLGDRELAALRALLSRPLHPAQRAQLAAQMAVRLYDRLELPPTAPERSWPPELFVERVYLQLAARTR